MFLGDCRVEDEKVRNERTWGKSSSEIGTGENFVCEPIYHPRWGTSANPASDHTVTRSSQPNNASSTADFSDLLKSSTLFSSSSPNSPFHVHNFTVITEHQVTSSLSVTPCDDSQLTPSTAYTMHGSHDILFVFPSFPWLQLDAWTKLQLPACRPIPSCSINLLSMIAQRIVTLSNSHSCESTTWSKVSQHQLRSPLAASKYLFKHGRLGPPSVSLISHNYNLQVHLENRLIMAVRVPRLGPPCAYLKTHSITTFKCFSELAQWQPRTVSPTLVEYGLQVRTSTLPKCISILTRLQPASVSWISLDFTLQIPLSMASKCIFQLARL